MKHNCKRENNYKFLTGGVFSIYMLLYVVNVEAIGKKRAIKASRVKLLKVFIVSSYPYIAN